MHLHHSSNYLMPPGGLSLDMEDDVKADRFYESTSPKPLVEGAVVNGRWGYNKHACDFFVSLLTTMYAFILVVMALVIEISPIWSNRLWVGEMVFYIWMYGIGILFFVYCYFFMLYPGWFNVVQKILFKMKLLKYEQKWAIEKTSHTGESAGSLYLRLGALFFGAVGIVLFGLEMFLCIRETSCKNGQVTQLSFQIVFVFIQMHFIFCNSKMVIVASRNLCKFGFMHAAAVNIFTWSRFVIVKAAGKANKKKKYSEEDEDSSSSSSSEEHEHFDLSPTGIVSEIVSSTLAEIITTTTTTTTITTSTVMSTTTPKPQHKMLAEYYFGDITTFLITCIVEFSLIGAAVMFILWKSIDEHGDHGNFQKVKRKSKMRVDCSSSSTGLFAGLLFLIIAFVSIGMFAVFDQLKNSYSGVLVFGVVDLFMFNVCTIACCVGFWRMRKLQYRKSHSHHSAEVLDELLLVVGLFGELAYCLIAIDLWISTRSLKKKMPTYDLFVFIFRLLEVVVQALFILVTSRLRASGPDAQKDKPGKQFVTFLLVANVTLFFFHTFEGMKSTMDLTSSSVAFPYIIYGLAPLIVFYRFHSSVCLAEIWKHTYNTKLSDSASSTTFATSVTTETH